MSNIEKPGSRRSFPSDPYKDAQYQQKHGGPKSSFGGKFLQFLGLGMQKSPPSMKIRKIPIDVGMTFMGKQLESMGKRLEKGLPQNKSTYDILLEKGHSGSEALEIIRKNNTKN